VTDGENNSGVTDMEKKPMIDADGLRDIYFAGGCFWGVEEYFSRIPGVHEVTAGYANGTTENPSYGEVCSGKTGHAETAHIRYCCGPLSSLLDLFSGASCSLCKFRKIMELQKSWHFIILLILLHVIRRTDRP
jgi:hypothetical protein